MYPLHCWHHLLTPPCPCHPHPKPSMNHPHPTPCPGVRVNARPPVLPSSSPACLSQRIGPSRLGSQSSPRVVRGPVSSLPRRGHSPTARTPRPRLSPESYPAGSSPSCTLKRPPATWSSHLRSPGVSRCPAWLFTRQQPELTAGARTRPGHRSSTCAGQRRCPSQEISEWPGC